MRLNPFIDMTHFDQNRRSRENESYRDEQPRFGERGQHRDDRSYERAPAFEGEREPWRGEGRTHEREYRGGMMRHSSRPNLQRQSERERYGDDDAGRSFAGSGGYQGESNWPSSQRGSNPWEQERQGSRFGSGRESGSFEPRGWPERGGDEGSRGFGGGGYRSGSGGYGSGADGYGSGAGGYGSGAGGSGYGSSGYGSSGYGSSGYGGSGYGEERAGRSAEHQRTSRAWQGSGGGSQESWEGPHSGKGPKGFRRSDERLNEATCDCLERNGQLDASGIEVTCKDGVVTLKGTVDSRRAKRLAEEAAEGVYGVKDVMNELKVQTDSSSQGSGQHERTATSKLDHSKQDTSSYADAGSPSTSSSTGSNPKR